MQSLIEFFGGPALTAAVCLGAIAATALSVAYASDAVKKINQVAFVMFFVSVYFLLILAVRGIVLLFSS